MFFFSFFKEFMKLTCARGEVPIFERALKRCMETLFSGVSYDGVVQETCLSRSTQMSPVNLGHTSSRTSLVRLRPVSSNSTFANPSGLWAGRRTHLCQKKKKNILILSMIIILREKRNYDWIRLCSLFHPYCLD